MNKHPLYKKIYKKMKFISDKLNLELKIEQSIKINNISFNQSRFIFLLCNYNNNSNIIQKNLSYIKKILLLPNIPKFKKGYIIEFIYGIDIDQNISKIYINLKNNNKFIIYARIYKNHNFYNFYTRYYIHKQKFYKKYPNFQLIKFFYKYGKNDIIDNYYLIYQNNNFRAISFRTILFNDNNTKKLILNLFKIFKLHLHNQNIINYLHKYKLHYLTNITINKNLDEINLYFNI